MILTDAGENTWDKRWFVLKRQVGISCLTSLTEDILVRPYLHVYTHSDEQEETGVIGLHGVNIEYNPDMENLLGVSPSRIFF